MRQAAARRVQQVTVARYLVALGVGGSRGAGSRGGTHGPLSPRRSALEGDHHDIHGVVTLSFAQGSGDAVVRRSESDEFLVKQTTPLAPDDAPAGQQEGVNTLSSDGGCTGKEAGDQGRAVRGEHVESDFEALIACKVPKQVLERRA
jgi:hypothetical protein